MRLVVRKIRFLGTGEEDTRCVPTSADFGDIVEIDGRDAEVIDEKAKKGPNPNRSSLGIPNVGGRTFHGGYRSKAWGVMNDPESLRRAKRQTPEWDFDPANGDALIPSQKALESGVAKIRASEAAQTQEVSP